MGLFVLAIATAAVVWISRRHKRKGKGIGEKIALAEEVLEAELDIGKDVGSKETNLEECQDARPKETNLEDSNSNSGSASENIGSDAANEASLLQDDSPVETRLECEGDSALGECLSAEVEFEADSASQKDLSVDSACEGSTDVPERSLVGPSIRHHYSDVTDPLEVPGENLVGSSMQHHDSVMQDPLEVHSDSSFLPDSPSESTESTGSELSQSFEEILEITESTGSELSQSFEEILEILSQGDENEDEGKDITSEGTQILSTPAEAAISSPSVMPSFVRESISLSEATAAVPIPSPLRSSARESIHLSEDTRETKLSSSLGTSPMSTFFPYARRSLGMEVGSVDSGNAGAIRVMRSFQAAQMTRAMSLPSLIAAGTAKRSTSFGAYATKTRGLASLLEESSAEDAPEQPAWCLTRFSFKKTAETAESAL